MIVVGETVGTLFSYLEVKDTELHSVGGLAVGQEGLVVEDTAHGPVGGGGFGLGGQGWSVWVYGLVQVSDHTYGTSRLISVITNKTVSKLPFHNYAVYIE